MACVSQALSPPAAPVPRPIYNRDGKNKFNFWSDGAGFASNVKLGRTRPKLDMARIVVPEGVVTTTIRAQYLRGLGGFGPLGS